MIYRKSMGVVGWVCRGLDALASSLGRSLEGNGTATAASGLTPADRLVSDFFKAH
jgi:hypothetical protein